MDKRIVLTLLIAVNLLMFNSCSKIGGFFASEEKRADTRMSQIVSAIKANDKEALKSLFSKKALDEADNIDNEVDDLFDFIQGDIDSWEMPNGWASSEKIDYGKRSLMIRFTIKINTDKDEYEIYVFDYSKDTINPDNQGVYMLEASKSSYSGGWDYWTNRMRAGIDIVE